MLSKPIIISYSQYIYKPIFLMAAIRNYSVMTIPGLTNFFPTIISKYGRMPEEYKAYAFIKHMIPRY